MDHAQRIAASLHAFDATCCEDFRSLDALLFSALDQAPQPDLDAAIFGILERDPRGDGAGVYWTIVHGLEGRGRYEASLVASLQRRPSDLAFVMVRRLANAGKTHCNGIRIHDLLLAVEQHPDAPAELVTQAHEYRNAVDGPHGVDG